MKYVVPLVAIAALATPAIAASGDDQAKVQQALSSQGYAKWKRIELDGNVWEVDDAIDAAGKQFDLRVDAKSLAVVSKIAE